MSVRVSARVWEKSKAKGGQLLLLLAIADFANDKSVAWPGVNTLAAYCRMEPRTIRLNLRKLEEMGELTSEIQAGPHGTNLYTVQAGGEKISPLAVGDESGLRGEKEAGLRGGGNQASGEGGNPASPEPSLKPSEEPSEEPSLGKKDRARLISRLETYFRQRTTLKYPKTKGEQVNTWEKPIAEALEEVGWDLEAGKQLVEIALSRSNGKFQVSSPKSIIKTVRAIAAEARTGRGKDEHAGRSALRDWMEDQ